MSKTKIFIAVIAVAVIGVVAIILVSSKSPISPGVSEETGGGTEPVSETKAPEGTPVSGTEVGGVPAEGASSETIEGPGTQEFEGTNYRIVYKTDIEGQATVYDVLTGKINKQKVDSLVKKIATDLTGTNPELKKFTLNFYSKLSLIDEQKIDVATISWTPGKTSVKMIGE